MELTRQPEFATRRAQATWLALTQMLVLFLLCAVPVLSTIAKDSAYLPQSNTTHFINIAAKMKVADVPVVIRQPQIVEPLASLELPEPEIKITWQDRLEAPPVQRICLTICLRHRSPPTAFV